MKKTIKHLGSKKLFLIGKGKDGLYYYLEEPSWDCDWYFGANYLEGFTNNSVTDGFWQVHTHAYKTFYQNNRCSFDTFVDFFEETVLTEDETWQVLDYISTINTLRKMSDLMYSGYSNMTSRVNKINDRAMYEEINAEKLPTIFKSLYTILAPEGTELPDWKPIFKK